MIVIIIVVKTVTYTTYEENCQRKTKNFFSTLLIFFSLLPFTSRTSYFISSLNRFLSKNHIHESMYSKKYEEKYARDDDILCIVHTCVQHKHHQI